MRDYWKNLTGLAGECAVMTELCLRGYVPSLAYNNCPMIDILCYNPAINKTITIQVKTIREKGYGKKIYAFPIMSNRDERDKYYNEISGPFVFVYISFDNLFTYYILSRDQFVEISSKVESEYDLLPRRKAIKSKSPMAMPEKCIQGFKDKWENLWK